MNKLIASATLAALMIAGPAFAADVPVVKAPPPVVVASWTGFYVGVEVGGEWSEDRWTNTCLGSVPGGVCTAGGVPTAANPFPIDASSPHKFTPSSARAGVYFGYNWQFAPAWVFGLEGSVTWSDAKESVVGLPGCSVAPAFCGIGGTSTAGDGAVVKNLGDAGLRARLGVLATPDALLYVTGGLALQRVEVGAFCSPFPDPWCVRNRAEAFRDVLPGWTVGGGIEWNINRDWRLRGEYRYADYGDFDQIFFRTATSTVDTMFTTTRFRTHVATIGIAHQFGAPAVAAKY